MKYPHRIEITNETGPSDRFRLDIAPHSAGYLTIKASGWDLASKNDLVLLVTQLIEIGEEHFAAKKSA